MLKPKQNVGKPPHPLGKCKNPGWSIPLEIRERVAALAAASDRPPSEIVTDILERALLQN